MNETLLWRRKLLLPLIVLMALLTAGFTPAHAQSLTVSGIVKDATSGETLPGVNVIVKGTTKGTITDANGAYTMGELTDADVLVFSFVGYTMSEVSVSGKSVIDVALAADTKLLQEVVVVGYGVQKKSVVTGAISSVKASDLQSMPVTRIEQALQGRTSGLTVAQNSGQPGSSATVRVRGITSFNNGDNNQPLWVVDGVIVDNGGIGYLNQSDIESIEVLKDAASQAIYGARGAAGVILVTTKKGTAGKIKVNYNAFYGTSAPARKIALLNGTQYATLMNEQAVADGKPAPYADPSSYGKGTDWQSTIFNNDARRQNHELSISGGNDRSTFYTSFGYLSQEGIIATDISKYQRYNVRLNSTHKVTRWLTFGENIGYAHDKTVGLGNTNSEFGGPLSSALNYDPITPAVVTDPAVQNSSPYAPSVTNYNGVGILKDAHGNPYGISPVVGQEMTNPLAYIKKQSGNYGWSDNIIGNAYLEAEPLKGLKVRSTFGAKLAFWGSENFTPLFWLNTSTSNAQTQFNRQNNIGKDWNLENTISYSRTFLNKHNLTALVGQGAYQTGNSRGSSVTFTGIPATTFDQASFNYKVPGRTGDGYEGQLHRVASLFARLNYNYDEKYLLSFLIRKDGATRFGANYRYGTFPSVSAGWVPSLENFWPKNDVVNFLKIRGSYGVVGNDAIGDFSYVSTIGSGRNYTFGTSGAYSNGFSPNAPPNPDLRWEQTTSSNVGFETTLLNNLTLTFDWYKKVTNGILQNPPIPGYIGAISPPAANLANMTNSGIELELGWRKSIGNFRIGLNGNFSYLKNEVTYIQRGLKYTDSGSAGFQGSGYGITRTLVGKPYNSFYGFKTMGIFQNQEEINSYTGANGLVQPNAKPGDFKWADIDGNGVIDGNDRTYLGNPIPKYTFGGTLNLAYKGFDFMIFTQGAAGNKVFNGLRRFGIPASNYQTDALGRWTGEGTSNSFPRLVTSDPNHNFSNPSDFFLKNGNYVRIKTVQLGYTLPKSMVMKAGLERVRIYVMSENLATFTKYNGYNPEIGGGVMSVDRGVYPLARSFMMGATVGF
jgi:TonB-linked SusC/RagA family outer membrane protein